MAKYTHLTLDDRFTISNLLDNSTSFKAIGIEIEKDCTTISKEVRNHRVYKKTGAPGRAFNCCIYRKGCDHRKLCSDCKSNRFCWSCKFCNSICSDFKKELCTRLEHPPYVCNGCIDLKSCTMEKCFYQATAANIEYRETLSESRQGISLSEEEIKRLDALLSPLIMKGQSLNHICTNNKDSITISESTIYRLVNYNVFTARNIDLPRKVRYSKRKVKKQNKVDKACRINRTYEDYKIFMTENSDLPVTEMDSVEGKKGGKVLLTIHFVKAELMLAFLRDANDSQSVIDIFDRLYIELRTDIFFQIMPVLLGDNGTEFSNPRAIEYDRQGNQRTHVFYCDPSCPHQKGSAERNHELIRYFFPKGTSFDGYTQAHISLMMDHINSYCRESLGNKCPYDMFAFLYGEKILSFLGCHKIAPNDVTMNSSIFRKEGISNEQK